MKKICVVCFWVLGILPGAISQTLQEFTYLGDKFHQESYLNFSGMLVNLNNTAAPNNKERHAQSVIFLDLYLLKPNYKKGGLNRRSDYKLLGDIFWLFKQITEKDERKMYASQSSTISGGILGWHHWTWNVKASPQQCLSFGFSLSDYFIGAIYQDSTSNAIVLHEPQGWQIGAGPAASFTQRINNSFILIGSSAYIASFLKPVDISYAKKDDAYPKPHFLHANITLMSKWGLFAEAQFVQLINRGNLPNNTRRLDLKLGFAFVL